MKALIIGAGPSIFKNNHLDVLKKYGWKDCLIVPEVMLQICLKRGITPDKFKKFYTVTLEDDHNTYHFFDDDIIRKYAKDIIAIISERSPQETKNFLKENKFKEIYEVYKKECVTTSNVGLFAFMIARDFLKCDEIVLIGLDQADNSFEHITVPKDHPIFKNAFIELYNPYFKTTCVMNPNQVKWLEEFNEVYQQEKIKIVNCTEGGAIFGPEIKCMRFEDYCQRMSQS